MKPIEQVDLSTVMDAEMDAEYREQVQEVHGKVRQLLARKRGCADQVMKARQQLKRAEEAHVKVEKRLQAIREGKWNALGDDEPGETPTSPTAA